MSISVIMSLIMTLLVFQCTLPIPHTPYRKTHADRLCATVPVFPSLHLLCAWRAWLTYYATHVRGYAVLPGVDVRRHALSALWISPESLSVTPYGNIRAPCGFAPDKPRNLTGMLLAALAAASRPLAGGCGRGAVLRMSGGGRGAVLRMSGGAGAAPALRLWTSGS